MDRPSDGYTMIGLLDNKHWDDPIIHAKAHLQIGRLVFTSIPMPPGSNERPAWKDTIKTYSGYVTRVITRFDLPAGTRAKPGDQFRYVWHCQVLEHEDHEMMRQWTQMHTDKKNV